MEWRTHEKRPDRRKQVNKEFKKITTNGNRDTAKQKV